MAEKLTDPSKPAHEIIEVCEDGDAIRNDGVRLTAANKNPWYVLATIYGEGGGYEEPKGHVKDDTLLKYGAELRAKFRRAWNLWVCLELTDEERADRALTTGLNVAELAPQKDAQKAAAELAEITKLFQARMGKGAKLPSRDETIDFSSTIFSKQLNFGGMVFEKNVSFRLATFLDSVNFSSTAFMGSANFSIATFMNTAHFPSATFSGSADFHSAVFSGYADFSFARFMGGNCFIPTNFRSVKFIEPAYYISATFSDSVNFSSAIFKSTIWFSNVRFLTAVPEFDAAQLFDDMIFSASDNEQNNWPPLWGSVKVEGKRVDVMPASQQKLAYNRLRLLMNKSSQIDGEQFFQRQEMRCKTRLARWYHKPFYWLYALLSDYGNSVWRPLFWMGFVMLSGALFMLWWQEAFTFLPKESSGFDWTLGLLGEDDPWAKPRQAAGWSISNTLPFLGFGKLYYGELAKELAWPLKVAGGVQTLLGYVLLFFFGLGLRNRFRLR